MTEIPIIKVGETLIAVVREDITDEDALQFQEALNGRLERFGATGVLIDVTLVATIDSFLGRLLHEIAVGARLLGAQTVVAGMQPAVAMTLVELGLELKGVRTVLTPEKALALLAHERNNLRRKA
ncbi:MAG: STAS domain-containing protein [Tepidiformaceae bacterium]